MLSNKPSTEEEGGEDVRTQNRETNSHDVEENAATPLYFLKSGSRAPVTLQPLTNEQVYQGKASILQDWQEKYPIKLYDPFTHHLDGPKHSLPKHDRRSTKEEIHHQLEEMARQSSERKLHTSLAALEVITEHQEEHTT
jgi:hypothetical protein